MRQPSLEPLVELLVLYAPCVVSTQPVALPEVCGRLPSVDSFFVFALASASGVTSSQKVEGEAYTLLLRKPSVVSVVVFAALYWAWVMDDQVVLVPVTVDRQPSVVELFVLLARKVA